MYPLPGFPTPPPPIPFTTEKITCSMNEATKGADKAPRNPLYCFFVSCFAISITPSTNTLESYDFNNIIHIFMIFYQIYLLHVKLNCLLIQGKLSLAKEIAMFVSTFFPKLPNQEAK